ncbi:MAG TPA: PEP/pyruvate-binding domain-containing protein [Solirubrobacteraceae bacterium]|nr:PEP/pyruvate-binding domain-containing protein [Solirubrobacteraceae bacterium]
MSIAAGANLGRDLSELDSGDEPLFGGKSAALGELLTAGIGVPPGFALSTEAYALAQANGGMPAAVRDECERRYAALAGVAGVADPPVAVRSSAVGEDSATATFAGQQETVLWVRGVEEICAAVLRCWASLQSELAVSYRAHLGDQREPAMGVAVQLMVDAVVSGVLFTCNPLSGDTSMVAINASWGLGLAVVGGEVTPDDYLISKVTHEVVREEVGFKAVEYVPDPEAHGVALREVPAERAHAPCLDAQALQVLIDTARAAERHFGAPQDVEWAIARTGTLPGNLFVLQSRAVTAVGSRPEVPGEQPASAIALVMQQFGAVRGGPDATER